jgi:hypothetical protein
LGSSAIAERITLGLGIAMVKVENEAENEAGGKAEGEAEGTIEDKKCTKKVNVIQLIRDLMLT